MAKNLWRKALTLNHDFDKVLVTMLPSGKLRVDYLRGKINNSWIVTEWVVHSTQTYDANELGKAIEEAEEWLRT